MTRAAYIHYCLDHPTHQGSWDKLDFEVGPETEDEEYYRGHRREFGPQSWLPALIEMLSTGVRGNGCHWTSRAPRY